MEASNSISSRLKCNSSLIGGRGISNNQRDCDFADGDCKEMDRRRDRRRSKEVEDLIFYFAAKSNCRTASQGIRGPTVNNLPICGLI